MPSRIDREFTRRDPPYLAVEGQAELVSENVVANELGYRAH